VRAQNKQNEISATKQQITSK